MPTIPAELTLLQDPDADPVALWRILARMPKDAKKAFRTGAVTVPYTTGVAMLQVAPNVPSAQVNPNLAAVLSFTETSEDEQLVGLAWNLFVRSLDAEELWFKLSEQAADAFAARVSLTLGKASSLVVSNKQYEALRKALFHATHPYSASIHALPATKQGPAADTLLWAAATNSVSDPELQHMLGWISAPAWRYVPDTMLETFIRWSDFATLFAAREVGLRMGDPVRSPEVEKAFAHIPEQLHRLCAS